MGTLIALHGTKDATGEPVEELFLEHLERIGNRGARPGSLRQFKHVAGWLGRALAGLAVGDLLDPDLIGARFTGPALRSGYAATSVNAGVQFCRSALKARGLPYAHLKKVRVTTKLPIVMAETDVHRALDAASSEMRLAALFGWRAGLRRGEICRLHADDLEERHVRVTARGDFIPKDHEERRIPIPAALVLATMEAKARGGYLFSGPGGNPISESGLEKRWRGVLKSVGLYRRGHGLHALRRTWATDLLGAGADVNAVRRWGGWSSLVTMQRYLGVVEDAHRSAVERLGV